MSRRLPLDFESLALPAATLATPSSAAIKCQDGSQLIQGNWMATPYCQDALLAQVATQRGFKTSFAAIRNNPNHKKELCRFLFSDIRVQMTAWTPASRNITLGVRLR